MEATNPKKQPYFPQGAIDADLVIDTIPDGLVVLDAGCRIQRWNKAMERLTGYTEADVLHRPCALLDFRDVQTGALLESERHCLRAGTPDQARIREMECTLQTRMGETMPVRKYGRVLAGGDGQAIGILLIIVDLRPLRRLEAQLASVMVPDRDVQPVGRLVGTHPAMCTVYHRIRLAAQTDVTVLFTGETGSGKELAAEALHALSARRDKPLVRVNCSALSESLLESELFGHVKGAFTGAIRDMPGRIAAAEGGTLFLDELGDLSPLIQLKLLRVLQEHTYERVGDTVTRQADVRFVAATHRNLRNLVAQGSFREDFYYRIRVYEIPLPSLRMHKSDILPLCEVFVQRFNVRYGRSIQGVGSTARQCLLDYDWPGNVRQLENALEHAFVGCRGSWIEWFDLPVEVQAGNGTPTGGGVECSALDMTQRGPVAQRITPALLQRTLLESGGNRTEAGRRLGVDRTTIWRMLKRWHLSD